MTTTHPNRRVWDEDIEWIMITDRAALKWQIAHRIGVDPAAIDHCLRRAGRDDLRAELRRRTELADPGARRRGADTRSTA